MTCSGENSCASCFLQVDDPSGESACVELGAAAGLVPCGVAAGVAVGSGEDGRQMNMNSSATSKTPRNTPEMILLRGVTPCGASHHRAVRVILFCATAL